MRFHAYSLALSAALALLGCGDPTEEDEETGATPQLQAVTEGSTLVELIERAGDTITRSPVILTPSGNQTWSSAFRLVCRSNCERALLAFGYRTKQFVREYETVEALRSGERLDASVPIVDLWLEDEGPAGPVLAAYRMTDATDAVSPRYLVRLRAAPDVLYSPLCEDFLRVAQGSLATTPITKAVLAQWGVAVPTTGAATQFPRIGCALLDGKLLPAPAPAPSVTSPSDASTIDAVWTMVNRDPSIRASTVPYVVTRDANGFVRGFAVDCGSDAFSALAALGVSAADVRTTLATDAELAATHFGDQPVIRCTGTSGAKVVAFQSSNETSRSLRFQFEGGRDLVELTCADGEAYWSARATAKLDVPYQALAHLSDGDGRIGETRIFKVGCRRSEPARPAACGDLRPGQGLRPGERLASCNKRYELSLQNDGKIVLTRADKRVTWSVGTAGSAPRALIMQPDGNLVLYDVRERPLWASSTHVAGAYAVVQTDGNFVIYDSAKKPLWSSGTWQAPIDLPTTCGVAQPGQGLLAGESIWSCDKRFQLVLQADGNLVLYQAKKALWSTKTNGKATTYVSMQTDGNLVVYDDERKAYWASASHGHPGAYLAVQNDGNLVVYAPNKAVLWTSKTRAL